MANRRSIKGASWAALLASAVLVGSACGSSTPSAKTGGDSNAPKKLDCAFIRSNTNCWRAYVAQINGCLGGRQLSPGKLAADGTCTLAEGVVAKLATPCDPDGQCEVRELKISKGDKQCLSFSVVIDKPSGEMTRGAGSWHVYGPKGNVSMRYDETTKTLTCADGSTYAGTGDWKKELEACTDETSAEGMPDYSIAHSPSSGDAKHKKPGGFSFELTALEFKLDCTREDEAPKKPDSKKK